jgi:hypothetical protein
MPEPTYSIITSSSEHLDWDFGPVGSKSSIRNPRLPTVFLRDLPSFSEPHVFDILYGHAVEVDPIGSGHRLNCCPECDPLMSILNNGLGGLFVNGITPEPRIAQRYNPFLDEPTSFFSSGRPIRIDYGPVGSRDFKPRLVVDSKFMEDSMGSNLLLLSELSPTLDSILAMKNQQPNDDTNTDEDEQVESNNKEEITDHHEKTAEENVLHDDDEELTEVFPARKSKSLESISTEWSEKSADYETISSASLSEQQRDVGVNNKTVSNWDSISSSSLKSGSCCGSDEDEIYYSDGMMMIANEEEEDGGLYELDGTVLNDDDDELSLIVDDEMHVNN